MIEETRPPPVVVVSWAATSEAAARIMTCENFMLKDVVVELIDGRCLCVYWLIVGLMMVVVEKQLSHSRTRIIYPPPPTSMRPQVVSTRCIHMLTDLVIRIHRRAA